jgi:hypothetical protein
MSAIHQHHSEQIKNATTPLEKDNFYYRQTNRDLKQKLREFVGVHEKQVTALKKAQEQIQFWKSKAESLTTV